MTWNDAAENMAVNVIAKVEGAGAWDAINYNDPITIGLMQWYGTRAAGLLKRIQDGNPSQYANIAASLRASMDAHAPTARWWTSRYLTGSEGSSLKPVLRACKDIQSELVKSDMLDYKDVAENIGYDLDANTNTVIFFMCMYHQTPARAIRIARAAGLKASLDRTYSVCMNDSVFGGYKSRYTSAYNYIKSGNPPEIIDLDDDDSPGGDNTSEPGENEGHETGSSTTTKAGSFKNISVVGDYLAIHMKDGSTLWGYPTNNDYFIVKKTSPGSTPVVDDGSGDDDQGSPAPDPGGDDGETGSGDVAAKRRQVVAWGKQWLGQWAYTNGPARNDPVHTHATDCSGFVRACYNTVGIKLGQLTSNQYTQGHRIASDSNVNGFTWSQLKVGDLVYIQWSNPSWNSGKVTDHVEMYAGGGQFIGQPGPGAGPRMTAVSTYTPLFRHWWVQRHLE